MSCKNELRKISGKGIRTTLSFDISDSMQDFRQQEEFEGFAKPFVDRIKTNDYNIGFMSYFFLKPSGEMIHKYLVVEVFFAPRDIVAYLRFEKDLRKEGYKVEFSREGKQGF